MVDALKETDRKRGVRRTAWWLALIALSVYVGFIALGVWRGQ